MVLLWLIAERKDSADTQLHVKQRFYLMKMNEGAPAAHFSLGNPPPRYFLFPSLPPSLPNANY